MKKILFLLLVTFNISASAQQADEKEKPAVLEKVSQFFEALEKQDTVLFKSILFLDGQSYGVKKEKDSVKWSMRAFHQTVKKFIKPQQIIQEKMLPGAEIKIHQQLAMAWVPYELFISDKFSHCGIDLFSLIKTQEGWKVVTIVFTVEPDGCDALKTKK